MADFVEEIDINEIERIEVDYYMLIYHLYHHLLNLSNFYI